MAQDGQLQVCVEASAWVGQKQAWQDSGAVLCPKRAEIGGGTEKFKAGWISLAGRQRDVLSGSGW